jgi:hypothetical protein
VLTRPTVTLFMRPDALAFAISKLGFKLSLKLRLPLGPHFEETCCEGKLEILVF